MTTRLRGRDEQLRRVRDAVHAGRHVVLLGEGGTGKTALWSAALASIEHRRVVRVAASGTARPIPFAALAALLAVDDGADAPAERIARALRALAAEGGSPIVLAVDDAHLLDDHSAVVVHTVAVQGLATIVATVRSDEVAPDAVARLWRDGLAAIVRVEPLDAPATAVVVEDLVGHPVEPRTEGRLFAATGGNPLFVRELVLSGVEAGRFESVGGVWAWTGAFVAPPTIAAVISQRLGVLDHAVRRCAEAVAVGGPLPADLLARLCGASALGEAVSSGLLRHRGAETDEPLELVHPLYAPVLRHTIGIDGERRLLERLIDASVADGGGGRDDGWRLAGWLMALGDHSRPELLLAAADRAFSAAQTELAEQLAHAAVAACAGAPAQALLERIRVASGRQATAGRARPTSDAAVFQQAMTEADRFLFGFGPMEPALDALRSAEARVARGPLADELRAVQLGVRLQGGERAGRVAAAGLALIEDHPDPVAVVRASLALGPALAVLGRTEEAVAILEKARALSAEAAELSPFIRSQVVTTLAQALVLQGHLDAADDLARAGRDEARRHDDRVGEVGWAIVTGRLDLWRGRPRTAARRFGEALAAMGQIDLIGYRRRCLADLAYALAWAGDTVDHDALPEVPAAGTSAAFLTPEILESLAGVDVRGGRTASAVRRLRTAVTRAAAMEQPTIAALNLHLACRISARRNVAAKIGALTSRAQGDLLPLVARSADAMASGDGARLEEAAAAWAAFGAPALACELSGHAAAAYRRAGLTTSARRCRSDVESAVAALEAPPLVAPIDVGGPSLTAREREVASLAARGRTNREIAGELGVSVRTVHTHLQAAYRKLGVNRRDGLGTLMG